TSFSDNSVWDSEDDALIRAFISRTYQQIPNGFMYSYPHTLSFSRVTDEVQGRGGAEDFINAGNINSSDLGPLNYWTSSSPNENYWRIIKRSNVFFKKIK